jgi:hypothetical protein
MPLFFYFICFSFAFFATPLEVFKRFYFALISPFSNFIDTKRGQNNSKYRGIVIYKCVLNLSSAFIKGQGTLMLILVEQKRKSISFCIVSIFTNHKDNLVLKYPFFVSISKMSFFLNEDLEVDREGNMENISLWNVCIKEKLFRWLDLLLPMFHYSNKSVCIFGIWNMYFHQK